MDFRGVSVGRQKSVKKYMASVLGHFIVHANGNWRRWLYLYRKNIMAGCNATNSMSRSRVPRLPCTPNHWRYAADIAARDSDLSGARNYRCCTPLNKVDSWRVQVSARPCELPKPITSLRRRNRAPPVGWTELKTRQKVNFTCACMTS